MTDREEAKRALLRKAGWNGAMAAPLAGDASARRYERLTGGPSGATAVLMDAPPGEANDTRRFTAMTQYLRDLGLSAPEILAADHEAGFLVLEDLGDDLFARIVPGRPGLESNIYGRAVDLLAALAAAPPPVEINDAGRRTPIPPYDADFLSFEAGLFLEWWWPSAGETPSSDLTAEFDHLISEVCAPVAECRHALVLRDFHAENLIWLPDRPELGAVGLLDYQDARRGHAAYDLVSLLEDARRDVSPELAIAMRDRYATAAGHSEDDRAEFDRAYAILGAQRNLKIVGIFARLWLRDGKPGYIGLIPRVWAHLTRDLKHPHLAKLGGFLTAHAPEPDKNALDLLRAARSAPA